MVEYECYVCVELIKEKDLVITGSYNGSPNYYHKKCWIKEKGLWKRLKSKEKK